jgi:hypothetical protein
MVILLILIDIFMLVMQDTVDWNWANSATVWFTGIEVHQGANTK